MKVNNLFFKKTLIMLGVLGTLLTFPFGVWAVNYGEGNYGNDNYPVSGLTPIPTATPTQSPNGNTGSSSAASFNTSPPGCGKSVTVNAPDLFEIRTNKDTMVLYFSPPTGEYSSFYVAFSRDSKNWEYGAEYNQSYSSGVLHYKVNLLNPNTSYYVKIRPGNGCATGNWSNVMKATTTTSDKVKVFYKNTKISKVTNGIKSVISKVIPSKKTKTETATIEPTSVPTVTEQKKENKSTVTEKKKFCILWWCF